MARKQTGSTGEGSTAPRAPAGSSATSPTARRTRPG